MRRQSSRHPAPSSNPHSLQAAPALRARDSARQPAIRGGRVSGGLSYAAGATGGGSLFGVSESQNPLLFASVKAVTGNVLTQGIAVATGLQDKFDWRAVATAAIAAPLAAYAGEQVGGYVGGGLSADSVKFASDFAGGFAKGVVSQSVHMAMYHEGKLNYANIAADAFGTALGNSINEELRISQGERDLQQKETDRDEAIAKAMGLAPSQGANAPVVTRTTGMNGEDNNAGSGLRYGGGRTGMSLSAGAVRDFTDQVVSGIAAAAEAMDRNPVSGADLVGRQGEDVSGLPSYSKLSVLVRRGDNPASLGARYYGDERAGASLLGGNGYEVSVRGARSLRAGDVLTLPDTYDAKTGGRLIAANNAVQQQEMAARLERAAQRVTEGAAQNDDIMARRGAEVLANSYTAAGAITSTIDGMPSKGPYQIVANVSERGIPVSYDAYNTQTGQTDYRIDRLGLGQFMKNSGAYAIEAEARNAPQYQKDATSFMLSGRLSALGNSYVNAWDDPQWRGIMGGSLAGLGLSMFGGGAGANSAGANTAAMAGTDASLPLGSKRLQFNQPEPPSYQPIRNDPTTIADTNYSGHAIDRMQDRGIMPSVVQNTIDTGTSTPSRLGTTVYYDSVNNVSVVVNSEGKVVTVKYGN